ncbi:MAG: mechanosensitive ion channel [Oscillospiraceae bacterium]|nr:mechanosensitive ion channel [Oscillospiraceae bacterium]
MEKKKTSTIRNLIKVVILGVILVLTLLMLNPEKLPFLTDSQKAAVQQFVDVNFSQLPATVASFNLNLGMVLSTLLMAGLLYLVYQVVRLVEEVIPSKSGRQETLRRMFMNALRYAMVIVGIIWGLMIFGVDTGAIFASVGIVTLVVSLSAESLFADMFTGIFILVEDQYHVGDIISIDGFRGRVVSLGIRTTRIEDDGGNVKIINNADIRNVMNLSNKVSFSICDISMSYGESIERAEAVIAEAMPKIQAKYPDIFEHGLQYAGVQSLSASSVDLRVLARVSEANIYKGRRLLNREMKIAFDEAGIEIPFPQLVVHKAEQ